MQVLSGNIYFVMVCKLAHISITSRPVLPKNAVLKSGQILQVSKLSHHPVSDALAFLLESHLSASG